MAAPPQAEPESVPASLVQQLTRERTEDGESLHAIVRSSFVAGDRLAVVHLAFSPPLTKAPQLAAYAIDDSGAEARVTAAETYGARIEVRLPQPAADGQTVLIEVVGS
jgi:hypothetical protein